MTVADGIDERIQALTTIACSVPPGEGGLGRNFKSVIAHAEAEGLEPRKLYPVPPGERLDSRTHDIRPLWWGGRFLLWTPLRWSYAWNTFAGNVTFDLAVARSLSAAWSGFTGFTGQSLASFRKARALGIEPLALVSPTSHVEHAHRQHQLARSLYPVDRGWLNAELVARTQREYALADVILINSDYQRRTFIAHGVSEEKLVMIPLLVHRPEPSLRPPPKDTFNIVYVGRFDLPKGLPVLLDAFAVASRPHWRLVLQGDFCTRRIRLDMLRRIAGNSQITILPGGDPAQVLAQAHVFVHPSFDDGYGLAPVEALIADIPVIATNMTGMSDLINRGAKGSVVPAGDVDALVTALRRYDL